MNNYNLNDIKSSTLDGFAKKFMNQDISNMSLSKKEDRIASWFAFEVDYGTPITKCGIVTRMELFMEWIKEMGNELKVTPSEYGILMELAMTVMKDVLVHQIARELVKMDILKNAPMNKRGEEYDESCKFNVVVEGKEYSGFVVDDCDKYNITCEWFEFSILKEGMEDLEKAVVVC